MKKVADCHKYSTGYNDKWSNIELPVGKDIADLGDNIDLTACSKKDIRKAIAYLEMRVILMREVGGIMVSANHYGIYNKRLKLPLYEIRDGVLYIHGDILWKEKKRKKWYAKECKGVGFFGKWGRKCLHKLPRFKVKEKHAIKIVEFVNKIEWKENVVIHTVECGHKHYDAQFIIKSITVNFRGRGVHE